MFSPNRLRPVVFDGILGRHQGNSFDDGLPLLPPVDLSEKGGKDLLDKLYSSVKSTHTCYFPFFFFTTTVLAN